MILNAISTNPNVFCFNPNVSCFNPNVFCLYQHCRFPTVSFRALQSILRLNHRGMILNDISTNPNVFCFNPNVFCLYQHCRFPTVSFRALQSILRLNHRGMILNGYVLRGNPSKAAVLPTYFREMRFLPHGGNLTFLRNQMVTFSLYRI